MLVEMSSVMDLVQKSCFLGLKCMMFVIGSHCSVLKCSGPSGRRLYSEANGGQVQPPRLVQRVEKVFLRKSYVDNHTNIL